MIPDEKSKMHEEMKTNENGNHGNSYIGKYEQILNYKIIIIILLFIFINMFYC